jgi:hypothetical protein
LQSFQLWADVSAIKRGTFICKEMLSHLTLSERKVPLTGVSAAQLFRCLTFLIHHVEYAHFEPLGTMVYATTALLANGNCGQRRFVSICEL